ncbi:hypothetical protein N5079_13110 [Planotetraspora sp. A-T 1434]|uniref:hypothetical protein n=1 Tax=Planotetraspora sp. A-T 1434 TaxID=2979219 RepID=UPI0021BF3619|nr:hypothetical protein [Planotetraspora sp. A-T 1434]MCT9931157.1 hypothetical protein [Planotetraspora sp. A-T 1434]
MLDRSTIDYAENAREATETEDPLRSRKHRLALLTDPYFIISATIILWGIVVSSYHIWSNDWHAHVASVRALMDNPWRPENPLVGGSAPWPYFEPYELVVALAARLTGLSAETAFEMAGPVNAVLFCWALRRFCNHLHRSTWTATLALVFTLFLWGVTSIQWSGLFELSSLVSSFSYPATLATALMLLSLDALLRFRETARVPWLALLSVLAAALVLIHPATAMGAAATAVGLVFVRLGKWTPWRLAALLIPAASALIAVAYWPYFDISVLLNRGEAFDQVQADLLHSSILRFGLVLLALPALLWDRRDRLGLELLGMFTVCTAALLVGTIAGMGTMARLMPFPVLLLHLALARHLAQKRDPRRPYRKVVTVATVIGAWVQIGTAVMLALPPDMRLGRYQEWTEPYRFAQRHLRPGDVVLTEDQGAARLLPLWGVRSVAPGYEHFFVPDEEKRWKAVDRFLDPDTKADERKRIIDDYGVRCVLTRKWPHQSIPGFVKGSTRSGDIALFCRP